MKSHFQCGHVRTINVAVVALDVVVVVLMLLLMLLFGPFLFLVAEFNVCGVAF